MRYVWYICLCLCSLCHSVVAKESSYTGTQVDLITNVQTAVAGKKFLALVKITPHNGWHIYWNNPGDTGLPTTAELSSDTAITQLKRQSSPKHFFVQNLITQYAYDNAAYWLFEVSVSKATTDTITLQADTSWLACQEECIAENFTLSEILPLEDVKQSNPIWNQEFKNAQKTFPHTYQKGFFKVENNKLYIQIPHFNRPLSSVKFIPFTRDLIKHNEPVSFSLHLDGHLWINVPLKEDVQIPSVLKALALTDQGVWQFRLTEGDFSYPQISSYPFGTVLLMAFIGGLILNLMPCIFPILFIKAVQLLNINHNHKQRWLEASCYFSGIIVSFVLIAGLLWLLRAGGEAIGWGFQLQSPTFIAFLFVLFFMIGLMFLGVIQFNSPIFNRLGTISVKNEKFNAFLTGLFAVLIASPCSAPFMGTAIGYSITQPLYIYFPIFMALAIGYALPFSLLMLFPQVLGKLLPRPGKWMLILKKIFALPVFLTCLWLGWIFYNQVTTFASADTTSETINWQTFSQEKLQNLKKQNKPIFIDFTAKWCLTCLVNEKTALSSHTFKKIVREKEITLLKADWTNKDEQITQALAAYNRNSVPLYVYYDGKNPQPIILPQILTGKIIKQYLK